MSVRYAYALARVVIISALAAWSCVAAADDVSPQPSAIAMAAPDQESAVDEKGLPPPMRSWEPTGFVAQIKGGRLLDRWNVAETELRTDIDVIAACRVELEACKSGAAKRLIEIVEDAKKREGRALIGTINRAVNLAIIATGDLLQYGAEDHWASPLETFASGRGDCEDYAIAKFAALRMAGFRAEDLRLLIVRTDRSQTIHAVLLVRFEERWLVLDNQRFAMLDVVDLDAVPLVAFRANETPAASVADSRGATGSGMGTTPYLI